MRIVLGLWLAALTAGCVLVYILGAVEEIAEGWRANAAARRRREC